MLSAFGRLIKQITAGATQVVHLQPGSALSGDSVLQAPQLIAYAGVSPIQPGALLSGNWLRITLSNNAAFTLNAPTGAQVAGQLLVVTIRNAIGGAAGALTFAATYKTIAAGWTQPANGFSRSIVFISDGTNYVELMRGAADVAN